MNRLSAQVQMYIGIAVIAVIAIAVVMLLILPQFQSVADLKAQIATEKTSLADAQALLARRQSAKASSAANEVELMDIANRVPDAPQLPAVIIEIQDLANQSGVALQGIAPAGIEAGDTGVKTEVAQFSTVPIQIQVRDESWADLIDFCRKLGKLDRGVRITSTTFTYVLQSEADKPYIDGKIGIEVYVMAGTATTAAPAASTTTTATAPGE